MSQNLAVFLIVVLTLSLHLSSGADTLEHRDLGSEGVITGLTRMGEKLYNTRDGDATPSTLNRSVQARKSKLQPIQIIVPFIKGFFLAGLTAAVIFIIKMFIMQSFIGSKLALILGSYFVLEKMARNMAANHPTVRKIIYHHREPEFVFPSEHQTASVPEPSYSVSHATGDIEIEDISGINPSDSKPHLYSGFSESSEFKSHPYSGYAESSDYKSRPFNTFSEISESKSMPSFVPYSETPAPSYSYADSEPHYSNMESSDLKSYGFPSHANYPESNPSYSESNPTVAESNSITDDSGVSYEQMPSREHSYSIQESDGMDQASNDQYYYARASNGSSPTNKAVPALQHAPIHVIAEESPASRPLSRRVFRRLPIVHHRTVHRY